jgi:DNA-binding response OmpR family regulator
MLILILEDDDAIRRMVTVLLEARGFTVLAASNGKDALDWAQVRPPDIAVLDLAMPGLYDGFEVIRRLRASPLTVKTPLIVLSARDDEGSRARAKDVGADSFLAKPFSPGALLREIERFRPQSRRP